MTTHVSCIVGELDCDGATGLRSRCAACACSAREIVAIAVPNRFEYGYGLTPEIVEELRPPNGKPELLITVDNGVASVDGVEAANALRHARCSSPIITCPATSCPRRAMVNPNRRAASFRASASRASA